MVVATVNSNNAEAGTPPRAAAAELTTARADGGCITTGGGGGAAMVAALTDRTVEPVATAAWVTDDDIAAEMAEADVAVVTVVIDNTA